MQLSRFLSRLSWLLLPVALLGTTWLYLYPLFHGCAFPQPDDTSLPLLAARAPFRLLALGDPQLEGDSSLPDPDAPVFPSLAHVVDDLRNAHFDARDARAILAAAAQGVVQDAGAWLEGHRKAVDLWGNDWYLAHIVRSLRWWTQPTHISVLGDLLGSQWITDGEFEKRAARYWRTVMRGLHRVPDAVMGVAVAREPDDVDTELDGVDDELDHKLDGKLDDDPADDLSNARTPTWGGTTETLGADGAWAQRVINIAGNHDIGYAGDIDTARVDRFERAFGSVNWDMWLTLPALNTTPADAPPPALRLVVLNTMNLDTPAWTDSLQADTYSFMNHIITTSRPVTDKTHATLLLTHIPLHKAPGVCVDSPYFDFFESGHGVREQNMLSEHGSHIVLESIFGLNANKHAEGAGMGRRGIVVNGHDHEGCDVVHYIRQPGIGNTCNANEVAQEDAYWPAQRPDETEASIPNAVSDDAISGSQNDTTPDLTHDADPEPENGWKARRFPARPYHVAADDTCTHIPSSPHLREITLRSMMGDFSGYAGFLSAWFDSDRGDNGEWVIEFNTCGVGVQHWWWAVHIVDLIFVVASMGALVAKGVEAVVRSTAQGSKEDVAHGGKGDVQSRVVQRRRVVEMSVEPSATSMEKTRRL